MKRKDKEILRWDQKRRLWRQVNPYYGTLTCYFLAPCQFCGKAHLFAWGKGRCFECREKQEAARYAIAASAHAKVTKAIAKGILPRLDGKVLCADCGRPADIYDHREYARPLDVEPVCYSCNVKRGPAKDIRHLFFRQRQSWTDA